MKLTASADGPNVAGSAKAHDMLNDSGTVPSGLLPSAIEMSWERCLGYGLDNEQRSEFDPLGRVLLIEEMEKSRHLLTHAQPVMDVLFEQIVDTQNVVVLANNAGYILHSCGDPDFLTRAEKVALAPGVEWSEANRGTNAIGTAIAMKAPVVVDGSQHFLTANRFLTCSASPIYDPYGQLSGILDVSGDHLSSNRHTMALVRMSVQMIENRMFASTFTEMLTLRFHARPEFVGTLCEGMAAFAEDGTLLSANRNACFQFGQNLEQLRGANFSTLFGQPISRLLDHLLVRPQDAMTLTLSSGVRVQARADFRPVHLRRHSRLAIQNEPATSRASAGSEVSGQSVSAPARQGCPMEWLQTGDPQIDAVIGKVKKVIGRDIPILIQGETGTGKELLANAIHCASPRATKPFIAVNCAAIPEGLIESELFGYEDGAFTGARRKGSLGRILQADGGTLFLDEIGDMPLSLQARLLRVLQERVVVPLGGAKSYPVNIAVICATHRRIRESVSSGQFREDLYFRLNGLTVMLPPLRARTDIDALVGSLLRELGGANPPSLDPEVLELFRRHPWPGNVRQLSNLLRTAVIMAEGEPTIRRDHLPDDFIEDVGPQLVSMTPPEPVPAPLTVPVAVSPAPTSLASAEPAEAGTGRLQDLALQAIRDALTRNGGNISGAARELGVSRSTLYRKLQG
ncbi:MAG: sigma-54-dependent Fis family transcriptional regulator [Betaproteobacteria bacterium]|nr:sigma-54-dependent Fis family transcriptional regulator [Betaproteobacteria bacterium]